MGLYERAKHVADAHLRALVDPGAAVPDELLKRAILELDAYRRELASSLGQHQKELDFLRGENAACAARLATWEARLGLADQRARTDLVDAASKRLEHERAQRATLEQKRQLLQTAIANITAGLEKVERTLRFVRSKKRHLEAIRNGGAPGAGADAAAGAPGESGPLSSLPLEPDVDPVEAEFRRLEHEEVTRHMDRRIAPGAFGDGGGAAPVATPPVPPPAP